MVRTIEELLGLPPMNQHDKLVPPMFDVFMGAPNLTPYTFIPNQISLDTLNTPGTAKLERAWQKEIARYFPQGPNQQADVPIQICLITPCGMPTTITPSRFRAKRSCCIRVRCHTPPLLTDQIESDSHQAGD